MPLIITCTVKTISITLLILTITSPILHNVHAEPATQIQSNISHNQQKILQDYLEVVFNTEGKTQKLKIPISKVLFKIIPHFDSDGRTTSLDIRLRSDKADLYKQIGFSTKSKEVVFIYPIFTQAAYQQGGFYDYYNKKCDSKCLTLKIPSKVVGQYSSSIGGALVLRLLNYSYIYDTEVDKDPNVLKKFKKVIVLHSEYVTKKEFDAITSHPDVVYLYPNALYAEIQTDYSQNTMKLVRGHEYPSKNIRNGFNWEYDISRHEYDAKCDNWKFYKTPNGKMLNCYPEYRLLYDISLLKKLRD